MDGGRRRGRENESGRENHGTIKKRNKGGHIGREEERGEQPVEGDESGTE